MTVYGHHRLALGARLVASLGFALGAAASVSCYTGRANPTIDGIQVSRELLLIDENAARYPNLYEAIRYLRPEYLKVRQQGSTSLVPVAYLNGLRLSDPTALRDVPVSNVAEVRWVRPNQTSALYGTNPHLGGGIFVRTR